MKKAEGEVLQRQIAELRLVNDKLAKQVFYLQRDVMYLRTCLIKARRLLGQWIFQRYDRERYPVGTTRSFLRRYD